MKKLAKAVVLSGAAAATVLVSMSAAMADHRGWRHHGRPVVIERHHHNNNGVALGVLGLAAGAVIGGAIADSRANQRVYVEPPRPTYYPPAPRYSQPVVYESLEPWSGAWYDYCSDRYRSFNASTGTYRGYDGREHFCVAN
ncbi:BA14K family protein [Pararhizobium haloflavum]|uniref:BA14K family protein n=1 Tax=Pararhizobium haloflavum TaxID=2037914 RepID=UPI000C179457|nr:BA14K family protein [Pararhizobium haloflavum]